MVVVVVWGEGGWGWLGGCMSLCDPFSALACSEVLHVDQTTEEKLTGFIVISQPYFILPFTKVWYKKTN